jgi:hypothetical protein
MDRFHAADVQLAPGTVAGKFTRADLVFYGVEHRARSFEALVFLNAPEAGVGTPRDVAEGYAGSFVVFGHRACFGDEGHCEVPAERDPFDSRPPHPLTPHTKMVEITTALEHPRCAGERSISITVLPVLPGRREARLADVLFFTGLRLLTYR